MTGRFVVYIEDASLAQDVVGQLQSKGAEARHASSIEEIVELVKQRESALLVQDRYAAGQIASSVLRQVQSGAGESVPATCWVTQELPAPEKLVLERRYKVQNFLPADASAADIAHALSPNLPPDFPSEVSTHGALDLDELADFDIDESIPVEEASDFIVDENDAELSVPPPPPVLDELDALAADDLAIPPPLPPIGNELTDLPLGFPDTDFDLAEAEMTYSGAETDAENDVPAPPFEPAAETPSLPEFSEDFGDSALDTLPPPLPSTSPSDPQLPEEEEFVHSDGVETSDSERDEEMQLEELQNALLAETQAREEAEKRIEELEIRLTTADPSLRGAGGGVPGEGLFEEIRYPSLLSICRAEFFSGRLRFQVGGVNTHTVFIRNGLPVGFSSSEPGERIGKTMVAQGRITDEQYIKAATVMVERGIRLADALVELDFIEGETLALEMRNLTRDQIIQGFGLTQGRFTTQDGFDNDENISTFDFSPGEIYVQGYRQYGPEQQMLGLYETLRDTYLIASVRLGSFRPQLGLSGDDERLLRLLGEAYTLEEAIDRAGVDTGHAARLIAALQELGLVEEWSPGVEQFRSRLRTETQRHAEEVASIREEMSRREQRLFEGFERALAKIGTASNAQTSLAENLSGRNQAAQLGAGAPPPAEEAQITEADLEDVAEESLSFSTDTASLAEPEITATAEPEVDEPLELATDAISDGPFFRAPQTQTTEASSAYSFAAAAPAPAASANAAIEATPFTDAYAEVDSGMEDDQAQETMEHSVGSISGFTSAEAPPFNGSAPFRSEPFGSSPFEAQPDAEEEDASEAVVEEAEDAVISVEAETDDAEISVDASIEVEEESFSPEEEPAAKNPYGPVPEGDLSESDEKYRDGIELAASGQLDEAEGSLREAVRVDASKPHYLVALARVLLTNPRYERGGTLPVVRSLLDRSVKLAPDDEAIRSFRDEVVQEMDT